MTSHHRLWYLICKCTLYVYVGLRKVVLSDHCFQRCRSLKAAAILRIFVPLKNAYTIHIERKIIYCCSIRFPMCKDNKIKSSAFVHDNASWESNMHLYTVSLKLDSKRIHFLIIVIIKISVGKLLHLIDCVCILISYMYLDFW